MECAKLNLQERTKKTRLPERRDEEKPRRYCQKRLVNPDREDSPRWFDFLDKVYNEHEHHDVHENVQIEQDTSDLYLSVQNLQFQGSSQQRKRPRTSFKYKNCLKGQKHRMFVKEIVDDIDIDTDGLSDLTCYVDYTKYFQNTISRSSSRDSNVFYLGTKENKSVQVDLAESKKPTKEKKPKKSRGNKLKDNKDNNVDEEENTKVTFQKYGARKSLTITRAESPETVQVIRVDVVCNHSNSSTLSDYQEKKKQYTSNDMVPVDKGKEAKNKYFLTNTVKTLDENITGGKVTLLCKTYRLTDRCVRYERKNKNLTRDKRTEM